MFDKRLLAMVSSARKHIAANVAFQWLALAANIALMVTIGLFLQGMLEGRPVAPEDFPGVPQALSGVFAFASSGAGVAVVALVAIVVRFLCSRAAQGASLRAAIAAKRTIRQAVYDKLVALGPAYTEHIATSEAVQVSVEGTEQLESYFGSYLPQFFYAIAAPLTLFVCTAPLCLPAAVVLLVCVPLIPVSIVAIQKIARKVVGKYWGSYTDLGAAFLENLQGLTTLKIYRADEARHEEMNREAESFRQATMRLLRMQLNSITIMDLFAFGGAAIGIIVVLLQYAEGAVSFAAAFAIIFLAADFFLPMRTLGSFFHTAMNGMAAADKMFELLSVPEPQAGTAKVDPANAGIECRDVSYSYDGERAALRHVDLDVPAGSFVGIVGESGSGKSTLAGVLSGRNAGFSGEVRIGGIDVAAISRESLMNTVTTVPFSSYLFKGTVRSNLLMARPDATDEELLRVLDRCALGGFVREAGGLDAPVAEQGSNLSGGQRQRLALARALLHDTPIYLFDEATSNIDAESEESILDVIHELAREKTVVMISHRLSAVCDADRIYVFSNGEVAESGTHGELLAARGAYERLWRQQEELEAYAAGGKGTPVRAGANGQAGHAAAARLAVAASIAEAPAEGACPARSIEPAAAKPGAKPRSHLSVMARLIGLVRPLAPVMVLAVALGVAGFAAAIFLTVAGTSALAGVQAGAGLPFAALALIGACGVLRGPLRYGEQICNHYIAFKLLALVRDKVFGALRRLAPAKLEGRDKGNLVSLVTSDIELLEVFYAHTISPIVIATIVSVGMVIFIGCAASPVLAALAAAAYLVIGVAVPLAASRAQGRGGRRFRDAIGDMNTFVLDSLRGLRETLQFGRAAERSAELGKRMEALAGIEAAMKRKTSLFMALTNALVLAFDVAMLLSACALCASGAIGFGAAIVAVGALMSSFGPVIAVANLGSTLQQTFASGARVLDLLDEVPATPEVEDGCDLSREGFSGAEVHDVTFAYGDEEVLRDVSLAVAPGQIVQIAGRSGSGKSTLCKLLMRFWDATSGEIRISGADIRRVNTASLRDVEGYMTQETHLFTGTIGDNIRLGRPSASDAEVMEACRKASIDDLIERLPQGLSTPVGELGETLSGGERQRIGLARVFLHDAPFMLLDEPTSNLDSLNEAAVLRALQASRAGKTIVLVSHRASTARIADAAYTVECGRVS